MLAGRIPFVKSSATVPVKDVVGGGGKTGLSNGGGGEGDGGGGLGDGGGGLGDGGGGL